MTLESKKKLRATKGQGTELSWAGCQNNLIDVNFYLQLSLEIFEKTFS